LVGDDGVGDQFFPGEAFAIHLRRQQQLDQAFARVHLHFLDRGAEVPRHWLHGAQHARGPVGIVLEVADSANVAGQSFNCG
jgi:hypothetical protein